MKKNFIIFLQALVLVSCADDISDCQQLRRYYARFDTEETKVHFSGRTTLAWNAEDKISVFTSNVNECYVFEGKTSDTKGSFRKNDGLTPGAGYAHSFAIFPYAETTSSSQQGKIHFTLPSVQNFVPGSFDPSASVLVAVSESLSDNNLKFTGACGYLRLCLYCPFEARINSITIKANEGKPLCGSASITASYGSAPVLEMDPGADSLLKIDFPAEGVLLGTKETQPTEVFCVLPPGDITGGIEVTVTDTQGRSFKKTTTKTVSIARHTVLSMTPVMFSPVMMNIAGTDILFGNNLVGRITDSQSGDGIVGVPVSDGFKVVATDKNGVYQMQASENARMVYYSQPALYRTEVDPANNIPLFYSTTEIDRSKINRNDFVLTKDTDTSDDFTIVALGDPQCKTAAQASRYQQETIADIKSYIGAQMTEGRCVRPIAITLGDIIHNTPELWETMKSTMSNVQLSNGFKLPFHQTIGNHDHNYGTNVYEAREGFNECFGPTDYSFNVGKVHVVVMDNTICTSRDGVGWSYKVGLMDEQVKWLEQDLALVQDKENKAVVFCCHAPFGRKNKTNRVETSASSYVNAENKYDEVLSLLTSFYDARILCGHTHFNRSYVNNDYICKSGRPVVEHNPGAACGAWWSSTLNVDGTPIGYLILEFKGKEIFDWRYKIPGVEQENQLRVYDGNQIMTYGGRDYCWYNTGIVCGSTSYTISGNANLKNAFVVTLYIGDNANWQVSLFKDGSKVGDFTRDESYMNDIFVAAYNYGTKGATSKWYAYTDPAEHYWYYKLSGSTPSDYTGWEVRATHTVPGSGVVHTYKVNKIKVNFSGFDYGTKPDDPDQPGGGGTPAEPGSDSGEGIDEKDGQW